MRWVHCLLLVLSLVSVAAAGDIQVLCEPGLQVYLDGELVGTSIAREDGLYLEGVPQGAHTVRVEKDGFIPQSFQVEVESLPVEVRVAKLLPKPEAPTASEPPSVDTSDEVLGRLLITSAPQNCKVQIDGRSEEKTTPRLTIGGLAEGEHTISFSKEGYTPISATVTVQPGGDVTVRGDLRNGNVEVSHGGKGSLRLISKPNRCTVRFMGQTKQKTNRILNMSYIPAGEHSLEVEIPGSKLATTVLIMNGRRTVVEVSFMAGGEETFVISHEPE
jgi:hypothetical protein